MYLRGGRKTFKIRDMVFKNTGSKSKIERISEERAEKRVRLPRKVDRVARELKVGPLDTLAKIARKLKVVTVDVIEALFLGYYIEGNLSPSNNAYENGVAVKFWEIYDRNKRFVMVCREKPSEMEGYTIREKFLWNVRIVSDLVHNLLEDSEYVELN